MDGIAKQERSYCGLKTSWVVDWARLLDTLNMNPNFECPISGSHFTTPNGKHKNVVLYTISTVFLVVTFLPKHLQARILSEKLKLKLFFRASRISAFRLLRCKCCCSKLLATHSLPVLPENEKKFYLVFKNKTDSDWFQRLCKVIYLHLRLG